MKKLCLSLCMVGFLFTGCTMKGIAEYQSTPSNVAKLQQYTKKVTVGEFGGNSASAVACRNWGIPTIFTPDEEPFYEYIRNALIEELKAANLYDANSNIVITGTLNDISSASSLFGKGYWKFDITISQKNTSKTLNVQSKIEHESSFAAVKACNNMAVAFDIAVKELIYEIITHEGFADIMNSK